MGAFDDLIPSGGGGGAFDDLIPQRRADPKIGQPEELSLLERVAAKLPDWMAGTKGAAVGRFLKGASDPAVAAVQLGANAVGMGAPVNKWVSDQEKQYQDARAIEGSSGFDPLRVGGNFVATAPAAGLGTGIRAGAAVGGGAAALNPVTDANADFWKQKGQDVAIGAAGGAVMSPLMGALARVVSPKASTDASVKMLRDEGVDMSVGQTLGGWANSFEQRATSLPFVGDAIAGARRQGIEGFNEAALNRTIAPGRMTKGAGHEGVKEAGDVLSSVYEGAAKNIGHANLVGTTFDNNLGQLMQMADGLAPELTKRFNKVLDTEVLRRMSPNGTVDGPDIKKIDSALGKIAADWRKSMDPTQREFGDAIRQLQQNFRDGLADVDPAYAAAKAKADQGWAMLKRVRGAASAAKNEEGVFTPAQLNRQAQVFDNSVGRRATAEGDALMQDLARAGQRLGTKVPDSGTAGRFMQGGAAVAALLEPATLAGVAGGYGLYSKPVQNALRELILRRPDKAPAVANYLRQLSTPAALAAGPLMQGDR